jgi:hypothetical protein
LNFIANESYRAPKPERGAKGKILLAFWKRLEENYLINEITQVFHPQGALN